MSDTRAADRPVSAPSGLCRHFGECGGCATQDVGYLDQLARKQRALVELFAEFWSSEIPVLPSPVIWHYRNKVDFNFALKHYPEPPPKGFHRETVLGFTHKGQWYNPLEIDHCLIAPEGCDALLGAVRNWARANELRAYDTRSKSGFLRALLVREGKRTGERMVTLFTSEGNWNAEGFRDAVQGAFPVQSLYRGTFSRAARGAFADRLELLDGQPHIREHLRVPDAGSTREVAFNISPLSFFQTNSLATETLYGEIRQWVRESGARVLYDLYGGAGGIALTCADLVDLVRSVESEAAATGDGEINAGRNGIENVFFTNQPMRHYLGTLAENGGMESNAVAVVDPPRGGMTPKPLHRLIACRPQRVLYVSCKASVLRDELPVLLSGYRLERMWAVDLFPHTPHVEVLASLSRL